MHKVSMLGALVLVLNAVLLVSAYSDDDYVEGAYMPQTSDQSKRAQLKQQLQQVIYTSLSCYLSFREIWRKFGDQWDVRNMISLGYKIEYCQNYPFHTFDYTVLPNQYEYL